MKTVFHTTINSNSKFKICLNATILISSKFIQVVKVIVKKVSFINKFEMPIYTLIKFISKVYIVLNYRYVS